MSEPIKTTIAVWVWLWADGKTSLEYFAPEARDYAREYRSPNVIGTTLISSVPVTEGVFGNQDPGKHEVYGGSTEKLKVLKGAVGHVIQQCDGGTAWIAELLQEALDTTEDTFYDP